MVPPIAGQERTPGGRARGSRCMRLGCGERIRTSDLRVMSPTSCRCSTPRPVTLGPKHHSVKPRASLEGRVRPDPDARGGRSLPGTRNAGSSIGPVREREHEDDHVRAGVRCGRWRGGRGVRREVERLWLRPVGVCPDADDGGMARLTRVERSSCPCWVPGAAAIEFRCGQADSWRARDDHAELETVDRIARCRFTPTDSDGRLGRRGREVGRDLGGAHR
jgi:hypothetical protein